jgi:hypothetical protein
MLFTCATFTEGVQLGAIDPELLSSLALPEGWLAGIPGHTFSSIKLVMVHGDLNHPEEMLISARNWFGERPVVASLSSEETVIRLW